VTKLRKEHTIPFDVARDEDTIRDALDELFTGKSLASRPTIDELEERKKEADKRLKADIPPGTGDVGKKTDPTGDALICGDGWLCQLEVAPGGTGRIPVNVATGRVETLVE
jgi:PIN like domain